MMEYKSLEECAGVINELDEEYKLLDSLSKEYEKKLEQVTEIQGKFQKELTHQKYRLKNVTKSIKKIKKKEHDKESMEILANDISRKYSQYEIMEQVLPKSNGLYLKIILGTINVSILNKNHKFKYKDEYEKFKLVLSGIGFIFAVTNLLINARVLEILLMFLLVWYYCTLTIRESILKVNGSKIKGWWRFHHFMSTVISGVLLIWPNNNPWALFRQQFMYFNVFISIIQYLQFRYQSGVLYRLKALGERHNMDITIEGFHSWMWRGLSFLLPFLYAGYAFQLYNAYTLYCLSFHPEATWQVPVLSLLFFILFLGNTATTSMVIPQKLREKYCINKYDNKRVSSQNSLRKDN